MILAAGPSIALTVWIAIIGSVTTIGTAIVVALLQPWSQARRQREERLHDRRADAYLPLVGWAFRVRIAADMAKSGLQNTKQFPEPLPDEQWWALHGPVRAFGSQAVNEKVRTLLDANMVFNASLLLVGVEANRPPGQRDMEALADAQEDRNTSHREVVDACAALENQVRAELGTADR